VNRKQIIQCITLSKAFGVFGGAILGTRKLREQILQRSRAFIGSTPLPLPLANAALQSLKILKAQGNKLRKQLNGNADYGKTALKKAGWDLPETSGPIVLLTPNGPAQTRDLKKQLLAAGIFLPFVKYPGGNANGLFRFAISSGHTQTQLNKLIKVLKNF
jgi:glycine C-acetyltransferase